MEKLCPWKWFFLSPSFPPDRPSTRARTLEIHEPPRRSRSFDRGMRVSPHRIAPTLVRAHGNLRNTGVILGPIRFGINIGCTLHFTDAHYFRRDPVAQCI